MQGGTIFEGTFKLPATTFLWSYMIFIIIAIILAIILTMTLAGINALGIKSPVVIGVIIFIYSVAMVYAPLDYVYTLGVNSSSAL